MRLIQRRVCAGCESLKPAAIWLRLGCDPIADLVWPLQQRLFAASHASIEHMVTNNQPLAVRMRPRSLDEVVGQQHLLYPGSPLKQLAESASGSVSVIL